ncbi:MAG TPA: alpha/beta fold hydrolase [Ilumatobacter sp.]|nr:alpha/beta fold hydrolase [Ilumatobacter sp.]
MTCPELIAGCEPWSHVAGSSTGVLVVHGFTGCPASVRGVADELADAGFDVEVPRLPGHGTTVEDMLGTRWDDWFVEVEAAYEALAARVQRLIVIGQSMGATLALALAQRHRSIDGVLCINPLTQLRDDETMAMIAEYIEDGFAVVPGEGSDIADPDSSDISYPGTPLPPLQSLLLDGVASVTAGFDTMTMPLRLLTSRQDHVVAPADSEYLAATWGGDVEHTWLERSFHVATRDFDRDVVHAACVAFVRGLS